MAGILAAAGFGPPDGGVGQSRSPERGPPTRTDRYGDPLPPGTLARLGTIRLRPSHEVYFLAALPDGERCLSLARTYEVYDERREVTDRKVVVCLWRMATGERLYHFELPLIDSVYPALSPTGRLLATAGYNKSDFVHRVLLWDVDTGEKAGELSGADRVWAMSFAADGKTLATVCDDSTLRLWDTETRKELRRFAGPRNYRDDISLSRDGKVLALVRGDPCKLELWDMTTGGLLRGHGLGDVGGHASAYSPDRKLLATTASDGQLIHLWDVDSGNEVRRLRNASGVAVLAISADGKMLAAGGGREDDQVRTPSPITLWDVSTGREVRRLPGHVSGNDALAFSPDGKRLISGGRYGTLHVLDVAGGRDLLTFPAHEDHVTSIAFSPDGRLLATGGLDGTIRLWGRATGEPLRAFGGEPGRGIQCIAFTDEGRTLISSGGDESLHYRDVTTGRQTRSVKVGEKGSQVFFARSPDGATLAVCPVAPIPGEGGPIRLLDAATGRERRRWGDTTSAHGYLCFSPDGRKLASVSFLCGEGLVAEVLDTAGGRRLRRWPFDTDPGPIAFSGDGEVLFMGESWNGWHQIMGDRPFHAWDVLCGEDRPFQAGQLARLFCMTLSPDGRMLAWGDTEGVVTLWDVAAGQVRRRLKGHESFVTALTFSADGKTLASGSADTSVLLWDVTGLPPGGRAAPLPPERLSALWEELASKDAARAFGAVGLLTASPDQAVPLLGAKLHPASDPPHRRQVARLIAALDSDEFTVREEATERLRQLGGCARPDLRQALQERPGLEARRRIEDVLRTIGMPPNPPERLREMRALEVLEHIGTPGARRVLQTLAGGAAHAPMTREAKAALDRLAGR